MVTGKAMTGGETYARNHLSNNDYYSVGETITGQWMGRGAELLGLQGDVTMEQFEAIRLGCDPSSGEFLRQRQSADRYGEVTRNGETSIEKTGTARNLYDFTISAPKDISIQAMHDPLLVEAHGIRRLRRQRRWRDLLGSGWKGGHERKPGDFKSRDCPLRP